MLLTRPNYPLSYLLRGHVNFLTPICYFFLQVLVYFILKHAWPAVFFSGGSFARRLRSISIHLLTTFTWAKKTSSRPFPLAGGQ